MTSLVLTKIFGLTTISFLFALLVTPLWTNVLYKYKLGKNIRDDGTTPIFTKLHAAKKGTPTMGGVLVWVTTAILAAVFWFLDRIAGWHIFHELNFLTRRETLLPLGAMVGAAAVGLADDFLDIKQMGHNGRGFSFRFKVLLYTMVAIIGGLWFYFKLGYDYINVPFHGNVTIGWLFLPFFILVVVGTSFAVNETDGLDGLAGGVLTISFFAFAIIAFMQGRNNLASFIGSIIGGLLAFLWFNVYPARFFMGDTGSMGLGVVLAIIAFLTNSVLLLPIIGLIFVIDTASMILQLVWRKVLHKKLFLSSPLHHHLEAIGWPESKVTMRFWILSAVASIGGVIIYFLNR